MKFASIVILTCAADQAPASRTFSEALAASVELRTDPAELERALCNVALLPARVVKDLVQVWQVHAPR